MKKRIYVVTGENSVRVVRASSRAQAISHVVHGKYEARVPTLSEFAADYAQITVEDAFDEPAE